MRTRFAKTTLVIAAVAAIAAVNSSAVSAADDANYAAAKPVIDQLNLAIAAVPVFEAREVIRDNLSAKRSGRFRLSSVYAVNVAEGFSYYSDSTRYLGKKRKVVSKDFATNDQNWMFSQKKRCWERLRVTRTISKELTDLVVPLRPASVDYLYDPASSSITFTTPETKKHFGLREVLYFDPATMLPSSEVTETFSGANVYADRKATYSYTATVKKPTIKPKCK